MIDWTKCETWDDLIYLCSPDLIQAVELSEAHPELRRPYVRKTKKES